MLQRVRGKPASIVSVTFRLTEVHLKQGDPKCNPDKRNGKCLVFTLYDMEPCEALRVMGNYE